MAELRDPRGLMRARLSLRSHTTVLKNQTRAPRRKRNLTGEPPSDLLAKRVVAIFAGHRRYAAGNPCWLRCMNGNFWMMWSGTLVRWKRAYGTDRAHRLGTSAQDHAGSRRGPLHDSSGDLRRAAFSHRGPSAAMRAMPTVHASGGKSYHGPTSPQANHYLRWAFVEAQTAFCYRHRLSGHYALALYDRIKSRKCHGKAAVALATPCRGQLVDLNQT